MKDLTNIYVPSKNGFNPNYIFLQKEIARNRVLLLQGGTRSGKTYAVIQYIIWLCNIEYKNPLKVIMVRNTLVSAKLTIREDLLKLLKQAKLYSEKNHNKTENYYNLKGNKIYYAGADDSEKIKGIDSDLLYINEMPQISLSVYNQLAMRCRGRIIGDYNPSYNSSWVYDLASEPNVSMLKTTYLDNPYLSGYQIAEIEKHKERNPEYFKIYGLGERGQISGTIFSNWTSINEMPKEYPFVYSIDFGFSNDPTVITQLSSHNLNLFVNELFYDKGLTNVDICLALYLNGITSNDVIYADSSEPKSIAELRNGFYIGEEKIKGFCNQYNYAYPNIQHCQDTIKNGYSVYLSRKGADSVRNGINKIKEYDVFLTANSANIWNEYYNYTWVLDNNEQATNTPIDKHNHAIDTIRYYLQTHIY
jgi:phage terminase large subunit